jgi:Type VI secretion system (T6SS), amidase effector protein 4
MKMATSIFIEYSKLERAYPSYIGFKSKVKCPAYVNETCATQLSYALNRAGAPILADDLNFYAPRSYKNKVRTFSDKNELYIFSVVDMVDYLDAQYGPGRTIRAGGTEGQMKAKVPPVPGFLTFGWGHIGLWTGADLTEQYTQIWKWAAKGGMLFWECWDDRNDPNSEEN